MDHASIAQPQSSSNGKSGQTSGPNLTVDTKVHQEINVQDVRTPGTLDPHSAQSAQSEPQEATTEEKSLEQSPSNVTTEKLERASTEKSPASVTESVQKAHVGEMPRGEF